MASITGHERKFREWPFGDNFLQDLARRLADQEARTEQLENQLAQIDVPTAIPVDSLVDTPSPRGDTIVAATYTPVASPSPRRLRPVPVAPLPSALPDGFLLYDTLAAVPTAIIALDGQGRVRVWNPAAVELLGWPAHEVIGTAMPCLPADRVDEHQRFIVQAQNGISSREIQTIRKTSTGKLVPVMIAAAPDASGGTVFTLRAIESPPVVRQSPTMESSSRSRHTRQLETLGRMLGSVTHDFNNILAVLTGQTELLTRRVTDEDGQALLATMRSATRHASGLASKLTSHARGAAPAPQLLDVNDTLRQLRRLIQGMTGPKIRVVLRTPGDGGLIRADRVAFEQIVLNLVANARDAMPTTGILGIRTSSNPARRTATMIISDTGTGFDATVGSSYTTGIGLGTVRFLLEEI
ncbi:MAG: two-component system sensor histidine kinase NtrB, partial [Gemmataceae bacterium]